MMRALGWLRTVGIAVVLLLALLVMRGALHRPLAQPRTDSVRVNVDTDTATRHLSEAIRFRTVSNEDPAALQTQEFRSFIDWLASAYPLVHEAMPRLLLGEYSLLYRWEGSDPQLAPVLLTAHYDVVPAESAPGVYDPAWKHPPFSGAVENGVVWGRGATDDKGALVAQLEAATLLLNRGYTPQRTIYFAFGHDEELGGALGAAAITEHLRQEGIELAWSLDEGSFIFEGVFPGVSKPVAVINVAEKGFLNLEIVARASGGHSSMPPADNAVSELTAAIARLADNPFPGGLSGLSEAMFDTLSRHMPFAARLPFANRWLFGSLIEALLSKLPVGNALLRTTIAPTMLKASPKANVLARTATATINLRLHPRDSIESTLSHVRRVVEREGVRVRVLDGPRREPSSVSDWRAPGFQIIADAVRETYANVIVTPGVMVAGSDSHHYAKVATNSYRFNPWLATPEDLTAFHGLNEHLSSERLAQAVRTYARILERAGDDSARP